jgi:hypothetical protein
MLHDLLLAAPLALLVGLSLGLLGGGGSILTVPIMVYVLGLPPRVAIPASLVVVGVISVFGAARHRSGGNVDFRVALSFGVTGILGAWSGSRLVTRLGIPEAALMGAFAVLMVVVSGLMLRRGGEIRPDPGPANRGRTMRTALYGFLTGLLTGTLGVGGGFIVVPVLLLVARIPMHRAVGTSLVIIALNCAAGVVGYLGQVALPWTIAGVFAVLGIVGGQIGAHLAERVQAERLRRMFGVFVLLLGAMILVDQGSRLFARG